MYPKYLLILLIIITLSYPFNSISKEIDVTLWLARSCCGEAGWYSHRTTECAAILHIYKKRAEVSPEKDILQIAQEFSSAIKPRKGRENPWVMHLNREATKPKHWPKNVKWTVVQYHWMQTIFQVVLFMQGRLPDPLPTAWNYGGKMDTPPPGLRKLKTNYENIFYERR